MDPKETRMVIMRVSQVHSALADLITTMELALGAADILSPAEQTHYERYWQEAHVRAIEDLSESLNALLPKQPSRPAKKLYHR